MTNRDIKHQRLYLAHALLSTPVEVDPEQEDGIIKIPGTVDEALNDLKYGENWAMVFAKELKQLEDNNTWKKGIPPVGANIVSSK